MDVAGTPDECRFTFRGMDISKEIARDYYRNTTWHRQVEEAKKAHGTGWRDFVESAPPDLPEEFALLISHIYTGAANALTGKKWFGVPPLPEVLENIGRFLR